MSSGDRREVFFAFIAPIGVNLNDVEKQLTLELKNVSYASNPIRLTNIFKDIGHDYDISYSNDFERYSKFINAGDQLRIDTEQMDIFALYGIQSLLRYGKRGKDDDVPENVAHIFRQLKRPEEILTLKRVFGRNILLLSCYDSKENRTNNLVKSLLKSERGRSRTDLESEALKIMAIDEDERDHDSGQRVLDCYQHADFVIDCSSKSNLSRSLSRLINIYFGHPYISPTMDEYCSYFASAASYRSLDLSRQVGAAIFTEACEVISLGCNEVPKAGGGTYWADDENDRRDYALGRDSNHQVREDMATDALTRLQDEWLDKKFASLTGQELSIRAFDAKNAPLKGSMIADVIEYGRMVHAEMNAITDAARSRKSVQDSILYCTTMPCHLCTKLVVASGIKRVVYVQPYPKSLVQELYPDSVSIDNKDCRGKVIFETLKGVTPNGYKRAFEKIRKRKKGDGSIVDWEPQNSAPVFISFYPYYRPLEIASQAELKLGLDKLEDAINRRMKAALAINSSPPPSESSQEPA